jgi:hypothetical protein
MRFGRSLYKRLGKLEGALPLSVEDPTWELYRRAADLLPATDHTILSVIALGYACDRPVEIESEHEAVFARWAAIVKTMQIGGYSSIGEFKL